MTESEPNRRSTPESAPETPELDPVVDNIDSEEFNEADPVDVESPAERPVSTTIGTGSFFGIGCSIVALLFVCVGVAIFMWRQAN